MKRYNISSCVLLLLCWAFFSAISISSIPLNNIDNENGNRILKSSSNIGLKKILSDTEVNNYTEGYQYYPDICTLTDEIFAIAWHGPGQSDDYGIYARVFNATSGKNITSEFRVNDNTTNNQLYPSICALSNDIFVVAWHSIITIGDYDVHARVFNATSGKNITSEFRVNDYTTNNQFYPSICALSNEIFVVAWHGMGESDDYGVYARVFNATSGNNITSEFRVNDYTDSGQQYPSICALSNDSFAVVWQSNNQDGPNYGIYARAFNATTGENITSEFRVNDYTTGRQDFPSICKVSKDFIAITWESYAQDGDEEGVYAKTINISSGIKMSSEFRINNQINGGQRYPSICALSIEMIAITWCGIGQNIDYDIHVSIFAIENINSTPDSPAIDFVLYLLMFIIIVGGITSSIVAGRIYSIKKKKYASANSSIPDTLKHKKIKKQIPSTSKVGLTEMEEAELKQTESEINVEKQKIICVVHKGPIEGNIYMCPKCNTFYCMNCARNLKKSGEKCWVCDSLINL